VLTRNDRRPVYKQTAAVDFARGILGKETESLERRGRDVAISLYRLGPFSAVTEYELRSTLQNLCGTA
jgi:hypothetical protein